MDKDLEDTIRAASAETQIRYIGFLHNRLERVRSWDWVRFVSAIVCGELMNEASHRGSLLAAMIAAVLAVVIDLMLSNHAWFGGIVVEEKPK